MADTLQKFLTTAGLRNLKRVLKTQRGSEGNKRDGGGTEAS